MFIQIYNACIQGNDNFGEPNTFKAFKTFDEAKEWVHQQLYTTYMNWSIPTIVFDEDPETYQDPPPDPDMVSMADEYMSWTKNCFDQWIPSDDSKKSLYWRNSIVIKKETFKMNLELE